MMDDDRSLLMKRARRAYEHGRMRGALLRASVLALAAGCAATWLGHAHAWSFALLTFSLWFAAWWRGGALLRGARYGLLAGGITFLLPLSLLRPCCRFGFGEVTPTCTMPEVCVLAGALVGIPLASLVMRDEGRRIEAASGMAMGVLSLAAIKCSALFAGEAIGLLAGLASAIAVAAAVNALPARRA